MVHRALDVEPSKFSVLHLFKLLNCIDNGLLKNRLLETKARRKLKPVVDSRPRNSFKFFFYSHKTCALNKWNYVLTT